MQYNKYYVRYNYLDNYNKILFNNIIMKYNCHPLYKYIIIFIIAFMIIKYILNSENRTNILVASFIITTVYFADQILISNHQPLLINENMTDVLDTMSMEDIDKMLELVALRQQSDETGIDTYIPDDNTNVTYPQTKRIDRQIRNSGGDI